MTGTGNGQPAAPEEPPAPAAGPGSETLIAAAGLLAHWWSRPVAAEVGSWLAAAEIEADVRRLLSGDPGSGDGRLQYGSEQVPALLDEYERLFGGRPEHRSRVEEQGVEAASIRVGESRVELLAAPRQDTADGRVLAKSGSGHPRVPHAGARTPSARRAHECPRAES